MVEFHWVMRSTSDPQDALRWGSRRRERRICLHVETWRSSERTVGTSCTCGWVGIDTHGGICEPTSPKARRTRCAAPSPKRHASSASRAAHGRGARTVCSQRWGCGGRAAAGIRPDLTEHERVGRAHAENRPNWAEPGPNSTQSLCIKRLCARSQADRAAGLRPRKSASPDKCRRARNP